MARIRTVFKYNDKEVCYEILKDGYVIYLDDAPWISQQEPFIPYPKLGYVESCLKQIEEICTPAEILTGTLEAETN